jgi:hypothetical protein
MLMLITQRYRIFIRQLWYSHRSSEQIKTIDVCYPPTCSIFLPSRKANKVYRFDYSSLDPSHPCCSRDYRDSFTSTTDKNLSCLCRISHFENLALPSNLLVWVLFHFSSQNIGGETTNDCEMRSFLLSPESPRMRELSQLG